MTTSINNDLIIFHDKSEIKLNLKSIEWYTYKFNGRRLLLSCFNTNYINQYTHIGFTQFHVNFAEIGGITKIGLTTLRFFSKPVFFTSLQLSHTS